MHNTAVHVPLYLLCMDNRIPVMPCLNSAGAVLKTNRVRVQCWQSLLLPRMLDYFSIKVRTKERDLPGHIVPMSLLSSINVVFKDNMVVKLYSGKDGCSVWNA